jgi:hypothetical protein
MLRSQTHATILLIGAGWSPKPFSVASRVAENGVEDAQDLADGQHRYVRGGVPCPVVGDGAQPDVHNSPPRGSQSVIRSDSFTSNSGHSRVELGCEKLVLALPAEA